MPPIFIVAVVLAYFLVLLGIAYFTSRDSNNESFFIGNRNSKWWVVAFGMIGTSLSGITFISVPGTVGKSGFSYFLVALGYVIGYFIVAFVLLPLYYHLKVTSIYTYLENRFGKTAYKTGALFFILSRTLGATLRLYLVIKVLELFLLQPMGIPFEATAVVILLLILLYTYKGGVKTIVWTDTLQTTFMLSSLVICVFYIMQQLHLDTSAVWASFGQHQLNNIIHTDFKDPAFYLKQIVGGAFITISMTGLDQEMMQKNISVSNLKDAQKNMMTFSILQACAVFLFLFLGGLLYLFTISKGGDFVHAVINGKPVLQFIINGDNILGDNIFPVTAFNYLPPFLGILFVIGLVSALFPSADGALTALTSSFCIDILGILKKQNPSNKTEPSTENKKQKIRLTVHYSFALLFLVCVFSFRLIDNGSIIQTLLDIAGYTYGPLLALFAFGILTKRSPVPKFIPIICILSPVLCYIIKSNDSFWLTGYKIGNELVLLNALITYTFLSIFSKKHVIPHDTASI